MGELSLFEQLAVLFLLATSATGVRCMYRKFRDEGGDSGDAS